PGERRGIAFVAGGDDGEETLLREFLRDRAADAPTHTDLDIAVIDGAAMRQDRIAAIRLPFRGGADHDADWLALRIRLHLRVPFVIARPISVTWVDEQSIIRRRYSRNALRFSALRAYSHALRFQPHQAHSASPITNSRSRPLSHGNSSVNIVTHCRQDHGILVMSVPQNMRCGPNASKTCRR